MIARIKGLKISQASERTAVTGQEMIPFQDGERNGKIRMIEFKDMTMYIFDPTIVDGKVSQEDYDALKQAIEEGKLIYTINSNRNGLDLATEVAIVGGTIYIESPDFIKEEDTDNISQVVFDTIAVDGSLNYSKEQYTTTVIKTTGDGTKVLTDNGQYVYIGNLALTNIKFKDGTNTSTYDLVTNGITFRQNSTPCVSWNTIKSGNNIYMDIRIANATASMDGLMSKEDYVELNTTIPGQIEDLKEADSNINNRIDDLDDKIDSEITNDLNVEIQARKDGDAQLQTNINNLQSTMNTELAKKVGKVTVAGSGNAVTTASISGDTLTLTKGATYNNYVHPAGSAPSKASGFYKFSTDSTSHVASVTAVTKSDITALGVPAQDTNTTYTFANGSAGNFTVTPSGGSAQTVSVGKPANAGNADTVGGISPSAFVKKAGDTMTGALTINQTSSVTPLTLHGTDVSSYIQFINSGTQTAEVGYTNSLGAYLYNDKLSTHPCISLGRVDSLDEGATFYYGGTHYKLLHKGNYANELDQRYSPKMVYNYDKGCLVKLRNASSVDAMITVRIFGNSYYTTPPFDTVIQFYNYNTGNSIIQYSGVNNGAGFGDIKVFIHDGKVHLWFKQIRQFQSFVVHAYYSNSSDYRNMVESISNAAMPTSGVARMVTITPKQSIYAGDDIISAAGGINIEHTNEINSYTNHLYLNHRYSSTGASTKNILMCANGGSVIVGVNVGSIAGDNKLYIGGNVASSGKVSAAGGFFKESDARLKSDIKPLDYTLDQICSIPTVSFIMNDQKQIGTIAQDLEELGFEDIVTESDTLKSEVSNPEQFESFTKDGEEYVKVKKVEYEMLGVLAIEGVKMLKDEIEKLKAEIETLKNKQHE